MAKRDIRDFSISIEHQSLLEKMEVQRGETQKDVNATVLRLIARRFPDERALKILDLPSGECNLLKYLGKLYPKAILVGADIVEQHIPGNIVYYKTDLSLSIETIYENNYDLVTSISGIMMFGNTSQFINSCSRMLKSSGYFIISNDNSATIVDRIYFLIFGRYRIFQKFFTETEQLTQNIPIQEVYRLLANNGFEIEEIKYTSLYAKDLILLPLAIALYPIQWYMNWKFRKSPSRKLRFAMYPFRSNFFKHYIIVAKRVQ